LDIFYQTSKVSGFMNNLHSSSYIFMLRDRRKDRGILHVFCWCVNKRNTMVNLPVSNRVRAMVALDIWIAEFRILMSYSIVDGRQLFGETCSHRLISRWHCLENRRCCFLRNNVTSYKTTRLRAKVEWTWSSERTPRRRNLGITTARWKVRDH
jgi:hypothetical protein